MHYFILLWWTGRNKNKHTATQIFIIISILSFFFNSNSSPLGDPSSMPDIWYFIINRHINPSMILVLPSTKSFYFILFFFKSKIKPFQAHHNRRSGGERKSLGGKSVAGKNTRLKHFSCPHGFSIVFSLPFLFIYRAGRCWADTLHLPWNFPMPIFFLKKCVRVCVCVLKCIPKLPIRLTIVQNGPKWVLKRTDWKKFSTNNK